MDNEARDTDADWRHIGGTHPFWGVLTSPEFRQEALDEAALDHFYASGRSDISGFVDLIRHHTGRSPPFGRSLDVGCGTGRLTEAMLERSDTVMGYDISPGMLEEARRRSGLPTYVETLPEGPFDWINSYIVFQHIPPARGYALLDEALDRLAPGGVTSLHFTVARHIEPPEPAPPEAAPVEQKIRAWPWTRKRRFEVTSPAYPAQGEEQPLGSVSMYDYSLDLLADSFRRHDVQDLGLSFVEHCGHYGYVMVGMRKG